ncbi:MAG: Rrf2 family transcriptional regulator [Verrucomicrobiales bacterium]|nr:Rrf2 family transcriptional regulator [Verrucomicrobiales bacterium]MCP5525913.1 Rrf2 family transcriptional regulator [Verrucomicrobiales bacterium]
MKVSVKSDYAARAVLELARAYASGAPRKVDELAGNQSIPGNYLVQILIELRNRGLVQSHRGKEGGYSLARPPAEITFGEVLRAIHGHVLDPPALGDDHCPPELRAAWQQLKSSAEQAADAIDFQTLLEQGDHKSRMYYI